MWSYTHLTNFCNLAPSEIKVRIKQLLCQQDNGKIPFATFCDSFCLDNGIKEERIPGGTTALELKILYTRRKRKYELEEIKKIKKETQLTNSDN